MIYLIYQMRLPIVIGDLEWCFNDTENYTFSHNHNIVNFISTHPLLKCLTIAHQHFQSPWATAKCTPCHYNHMIKKFICNKYINKHLTHHYFYYILLSIYSPFSYRVRLPLHNIPSPFISVVDIFFGDLKFCHICFYNTRT